MNNKFAHTDTENTPNTIINIPDHLLLDRITPEIATSKSDCAKGESSVQSRAIPSYPLYKSANIYPSTIPHKGNGFLYLTEIR